VSGVCVCVCVCMCVLGVCVHVCAHPHSHMQNFVGLKDQNEVCEVYIDMG